MPIVYTEAIATKLTLPILTVTATSMTVESVDQMPTLAPGEFFYLTIYNNDVGTFETVRVTNITGLVLTIVRGIDGTTVQTFQVNGTSVEAWVTGILWEDLRSQANDTFCTDEQIAAATAAFLVQSQIQSLIDTSLVPYITTATATALITDFQDEAEIQALIDTALLGYTTTAQAQALITASIDSEVTSRDLQDGTQVDTAISDALTAGGFITQVEITNNGEPFGILAGLGTLASPLFVDWDGRNPVLLDSIPLNNAHRSDTNNPHFTSASQVNCLTIGTPDIGIGFVPTDDDHPANKKYVDDKFLANIEAQVDVSNWLLVFDPTDVLALPYYGFIDLGIDVNDPDIKYRRVWVRDEIAKITPPGNAEGPYTFTIPLPVQLDTPPVDVKVILDVGDFSLSEQTRIDSSLYITSISNTQITFIFDTAKDGQGLTSVSTLKIYYTYSGTIDTTP